MRAHCSRIDGDNNAVAGAPVAKRFVAHILAQTYMRILHAGVRFHCPQYVACESMYARAYAATLIAAAVARTALVLAFSLHLPHAGAQYELSCI